MSSTVVITYTHSLPHPGFDKMKESVETLGYELAVISSTDNPRQIMKDLHACYKRAVTGHDYYIYADAVDTYFQRLVNVPKDYLLYSTEKRCFPFPEWGDKFPDVSRWRFLNNGNHCGPLSLQIEFAERYGLEDIGSKNGQAEVQRAYLEAVKDGFPIKLDTNQDEMCSIAFECEDEYDFVDGLFHNRITNTFPAIMHGNGITPMDRFYNIGNKRQKF